jgi:hypothetical protein
MQEVESMRDMNLCIFSFYPVYLVYDLIPPFVHAFITNVKLRIKDPQKTESLGSKYFQRKVFDFFIGKGVIF